MIFLNSISLTLTCSLFANTCNEYLIHYTFVYAVDMTLTEKIMRRANGFLSNQSRIITWHPCTNLRRIKLED